MQNVHEVRSTLGAFGYNRPFVPGYSDIVRPLLNLTKKDVPFEWTPACTNAIRKLKAIIRTDPVLRCPDHDKPFFLEVDASQYALGTVLSQRNERGKLQPVGYFSKTLIPAEHNYDVYDRELLALVRALENWRHLLLGAKHQVEVFTDHEGLTKYRHAQKISRRVACYLPVLWEYNILIKHRAGSANKVADALSWPPGTDEGSEDNQDVVVLLDHLFAHVVDTDDLRQCILKAQESNEKTLIQWEDPYSLFREHGTWVMRGCLVVPEETTLR